MSECECWMNIKWTENHLICRCMLKIIHGWQFQGWWDPFLWARFLDSSSETFARHLPQDGGSNLWRANGYNKLNPDEALNRRQHRTDRGGKAMEFSSHQITGIMSLVYISLKIKMLNYPYVTLRLIISSSETFRVWSCRAHDDDDPHLLLGVEMNMSSFQCSFNVRKLCELKLSLFSYKCCGFSY